jgi:electron transport complex protein RnfG
MSESVTQHAAKTALTMICFALIGTAALAFIFEQTKAPIAASEAEARLALFQQVLPKNTYDNDILKNSISISPDPLLGNTQATVANIATSNGAPVGIILEAIAHDGYSGDIKLLIAVRADGSLSGVRVLTHKETPGLGDYIDILKDDWITQFNDESLTKTAEIFWKVKKDGGKFEYMAGATITPRAVVSAVHKALLYFSKHQQELFSKLPSPMTKEQP